MNAQLKARLTDRVTGEEKVVLAQYEDLTGRRGNMRPTLKWGGCRVERGPDNQMLFREWSPGKWEPIGRKCLGTPLDGSDPTDMDNFQISPSGEMWVRDETGEWILGGAVESVVGA
jgi:hypothetical protein